MPRVGIGQDAPEIAEGFEGCASQEGEGEDGESSGYDPG